MIWLVTLLSLALGLAVGYFIAQRSSHERKKLKSLEAELADKNQEMENYRQQVTGHFQQTAELFGQLTQDYRAIYQHLADSSQTLCNQPMPQPELPEVDNLKIEGANPAAEPSVAVKEETAEPSAATGEAEAEIPQEAAEAIAADEARAREHADEHADTDLSGDLPPVSPHFMKEEEEDKPKSIH